MKGAHEELLSLFHPFKPNESKPSNYLLAGSLFKTTA